MCACSVSQLVWLFATQWICSPPGSSVHGISQTRILEWVAITPSGDLTDPEIKPMSPASPALAGGFFTTEPPGKSCVKWSFITIYKRHLGTWSDQIRSDQSLSRVRLFANPWIEARQASLSITNSRSSLRLMSMSQWCHPAISSSVIPFSSCPQSLPASGSFPMSQCFAWGGQSPGVSALASFLPKKSQVWSPSEWTGWISLQSKGPYDHI